ncbi:MAG: hypothetical protein AAGH53_13440 [Pseudomonadota bacterium]
MLEQFALEYVDNHDWRLLAFAISMILALVGAALINESEWRLSRAPFIGLVVAISHLTESVGFIWSLAEAAEAAGYIWALASLEFLIFVALNYTLATVAQARCRDAYGIAENGRVAFALVGCLFTRLFLITLLFKGSQKTEDLEKAFI